MYIIQMSSVREVFCATESGDFAAVALFLALVASETLPFFKGTRCQGLLHSLSLVLQRGEEEPAREPVPRTDSE